MEGFSLDIQNAWEYEMFISKDKDYTPEVVLDNQ